MKPLTVNVEQARQMAARMKELGWPERNRQSQGDDPELAQERLIDYYFYTSMLLFDFKGMEHTFPDGTYIKGTDVFTYLARRAAEENPDFWTAEHLIRMSDEDYMRAFSLDRDPTSPDVIRMPERIALLRDAAAVLLRDWEGSAAHMVDSHQRLADDEKFGVQGILSTFDTFEGYRDPLYKKAFVFLKILDARGIWRPADPENIMIPVDYHVTRMALRNGIVDVNDPALAEKLRNQEEATWDEQQQIRSVVLEACQTMARESGLSIYFIDDVYFLVGRSCCHYARPPRCTSCDFTDCTVQPGFDYTCPGKCPLATHCLGAQEEERRTLLEPNIVTQYY